jgi:hypothetical protein
MIGFIIAPTWGFAARVTASCACAGVAARARCPGVTSAPRRSTRPGPVMASRHQSLGRTPERLPEQLRRRPDASWHLEVRNAGEVVYGVDDLPHRGAVAPQELVGLVDGEGRLYYGVGELLGVKFIGLELAAPSPDVAIGGRRAPAASSGLPESGRSHLPGERRVQRRRSARRVLFLVPIWNIPWMMNSDPDRTSTPSGSEEERNRPGGRLLDPEDVPDHQDATTRRERYPAVPTLPVQQITGRFARRATRRSRWRTAVENPAGSWR